MICNIIKRYRRPSLKIVIYESREYFFSKSQLALNLLTVEVTTSHSNIRCSARLIRTSDRTVAETSTCDTQLLEETDIHALAGLEPTFPANEGRQTHALDRVATRIGE
jgi:hypothetical protein